MEHLNIQMDFYIFTVLFSQIYPKTKGNGTVQTSYP